MEIPADFDRRLSLLELLVAAGGEAEEVQRDEVPAQLLTKPVRRLDAAALCHLLRHDVALEFTAPLALERLAEEPLLQAQQYPGDLLVAAMESRTAFWQERRDLWLLMVEVLERAVQTITEKAEAEELGDYMPWYVGDDFMGALLHFRGIHP